MIVSIPSHQVEAAWSRVRNHIRPNWSHCDVAKRQPARDAVACGLRELPRVRLIRGHGGIEMRLYDGRHRLRALIESGRPMIEVDVIAGAELLEELTHE